MQNYKEKIFWIDFLKCISIIGVLIIHVSAPILYNTPITSESWLVANFYNSLTRFSVPVFIIITGVLLLHKQNTITNHIKKIIYRIIIPFLFWAVCYLLYKIQFDADYNFFGRIIYFFRYAFVQLRDGMISYHFWYIYMIIGLYLIIPILNKWIVNSNKKEILYFIIIWFCIQFFDMPRLNILKTNLDLRYFSGYIGFLILGYYINAFQISKKIKIFSLVILVFCLVFTYLSTYYSSLGNVYNDTFHKYLSINIILLSISIVIVLKNILFSNQKLVFIIQKISQYSYGIYLSHVLILAFIKDFNIQIINFNSIWYIPLIVIICLALSFSLIFLVKKTPFIGKYIAG